MTAAAHTELIQIAQRAATHINDLNGENAIFEIDGATMTAIIEYKSNPSWWIESETVIVNAVYNNDNGIDDCEAVEWLKNMLN